MRTRKVTYWVDFESWRVTVPAEGGKDAAYKEVIERFEKKVFPEIAFIEIDVRPPLRLCDEMTDQKDF